MAESDNQTELPVIKPAEQKQLDKLHLDLVQITHGHSIFTANQAAIFYKRTPANWSFKRPGKAGQVWKFVKKGYVRSQLNILFSFDYDFKTHTSVSEAFDVASKTGSVIINGTLTGRVHDKQGVVVATISRSDYGSVPVKFKKEKGEKILENGRVERNEQGYKVMTDIQTKEPLDFGNDIKAATTDCIKRCAAQLGIASDIYDQDEFIDLVINDPDQEVETEQEANVKKMIRDAKKVVAKPGRKVKNG